MTRQQLMVQQHLTFVPDIRQDTNRLGNGSVIVRLEIIGNLVISASDPAVFDEIAASASLAAESIRQAHRKQAQRA